MKKDNDKIKRIYMFIEAEEAALNEAGLEVGTVEFTCPLCDGKAKAHRYYSGGRIRGLGSGCEECGMWHVFVKRKLSHILIEN